MKKKILITGVILFFLAFIFPPWNNVYEILAGNDQMSFRPLWSSNQGVYAINTKIWVLTLASIAFGTFIFRSLAEDDSEIADEVAED